MTVLTNCPNTVGYFQYQDIIKEIEYPVSCKSLRCSICRKIRVNQVRDRIRLNFSEIPCRMWTLTLRNTPRVKIDDKDITKFWNRLRTQLRHKNIKNIKYFWVKEFTKKGFRHLHIIIEDLPISINELQQMWYTATDNTSWMVDTGRPTFDIRNPAGYLSKYITKAVSAIEYKEKVYQFSYNCLKLPPYKPDIALRYSPLSFEQQQGRYEQLVGKIDEWNIHLDNNTRAVMNRWERLQGCDG